jgi:hypothetical protein
VSWSWEMLRLAGRDPGMAGRGINTGAAGCDTGHAMQSADPPQPRSYGAVRSRGRGRIIGGRNGL